MRLHWVSGTGANTANKAFEKDLKSIYNTPLTSRFDASSCQSFVIVESIINGVLSYAASSHPALTLIIYCKVRQGAYVHRGSQLNLDLRSIVSSSKQKGSKIKIPPKVSVRVEKTETSTSDSAQKETTEYLNNLKEEEKKLKTRQKTKTEESRAEKSKYSRVLKGHGRYWIEWHS